MLGIISILFNPFQNPIQRLPYSINFNFHEFGCYIGIVALGTIAWSFQSKKFVFRNIAWLIGSGIWFWVASGWGSSWNPWSLYQKISIANFVHVQSRTFILFYLCFVVLLCKALNRIPRKHWSLPLLVGLLVCEALFVKTYPFSRQFQEEARNGIGAQLIKDSSFGQTIVYARKPSHYLEGGRGSHY